MSTGERYAGKYRFLNGTGFEMVERSSKLRLKNCCGAGCSVDCLVCASKEVQIVHSDADQFEVSAGKSLLYVPIPRPKVT